jgi:hypothetical protein
MNTITNSRPQATVTNFKDLQRIHENIKNEKVHKLADIFLTPIKDLTDDLLKVFKNDPSLRPDNLTDLTVLRSREWRHAPDTEKAISYGAVMEADNGPLWAITAAFSQKLQDQIVASDDSPSTILKKRFSKEFGESIPRAGAFEYGGQFNKDCLHVHMLLPKALFPDADDLRQRLYRVFGKRGDGYEIDIKDTQSDKPFRAMSTFGVEVGGPEGWLLYGSKRSALTRNKLERPRRRHRQVGRVRTSERKTNKRLKASIDDLGLDLKQHNFYFDDMLFKSDCVLRNAKALWQDCHDDFVRELWVEVFADSDVPKVVS